MPQVAHGMFTRPVPEMCALEALHWLWKLWDMGGLHERPLELAGCRAWHQLAQGSPRNPFQEMVISRVRVRARVRVAVVDER